jgi:hypothetical protein
MVLDNDSWVMNIKHELANIGLAYLWDESDIYRTAYKIIEQKISDVYKDLHLNFLRHPNALLTIFVYSFIFKHLLIAMERNT